MEELKINETPVRTSQNFNANNITIKDVIIPEQIKEFNNISIKNNNIKIEENLSNINLSYGIGERLIEQIIKQSNKKIKIDVKENITEQIEFKFDKNNSELVENIEIIANENSISTIILKYEAEEDIEAWHNGLIRIFAKSNSKIKVVFINLMNTKSHSFISIENNIEENANVDYTVVDFGGKNSITNYYTNILGDNGNNNIDTIYLGKEEQLFDLNYIVELRGKKSNVNIEVQGALKDNARKHFKGTIDFKRGCKKAKGNENENCMLLSDTAKSLALPMLLCSEEDVEGNHSSSAGKIGEKELFYIMSRGFELKEALKLMVRAKFNKILEKISDEELKEQILKEIDDRLE